MLENKVKSLKLNNEDVIATSYTCDNSPYHLIVSFAIPDKPEDTILLKSKNGHFEVTDEIDPKLGVPKALKNYGSVGTNYFEVELGPDAANDDMYYFTGSGWKKCDKDLSKHMSSGI